MIWEGSAVRLEARFYDIDDPTVLKDPDGEVLLQVRNPAGENDYSTPEHTGEGSYEYIMVVDQPGRWRYRVASSGVTPGVDEGIFFVRPSQFR